MEYIMLNAGLCVNNTMKKAASQVQIQLHRKVQDENVIFIVIMDGFS